MTFDPGDNVRLLPAGSPALVVVRQADLDEWALVRYICRNPRTGEESTHIYYDLRPALTT